MKNKWPGHMTREEAKSLVQAYLDDIYDEVDDSLVVLDGETIEKSYGWVLFYQSRTFVESGNWSFALAGNGPLVVLASDGSIHALGSANPPEEEILAFERTAGLVS